MMTTQNRELLQASTIPSESPALLGACRESPIPLPLGHSSWYLVLIRERHQVLLVHYLGLADTGTSGESCPVTVTAPRPHCPTFASSGLSLRPRVVPKDSGLFPFSEKKETISICFANKNHPSLSKKSLKKTKYQIQCPTPYHQERGNF